MTSGFVQRIVVQFLRKTVVRKPRDRNSPVGMAKPLLYGRERFTWWRSELLKSHLGSAELGVDAGLMLFGTVFR